MYLRALNDSTEAKKPYHYKWKMVSLSVLSHHCVECDFVTWVHQIFGRVDSRVTQWNRKRRASARARARIAYVNPPIPSYTSWCVCLCMCIRQKAHRKARRWIRECRWNKKLNSFCFESQCSRRFLFADWKLITHASYGNGKKEATKTNRCDWKLPEKMDFFF